MMQPSALKLRRRSCDWSILSLQLLLVSDSHSVAAYERALEETFDVLEQALG